MKKKSFLSGFSAKIALVAVALSSALLTGCYKDEGLDTDTPAGTVTLPDATYTLTGTIVDKDGVMIAGATGTAAGQAFTGATFSVKVQPGEQTIIAKAEGYKEVTKKVQILAVEAGQSAVYSEVIVLTKEEANPEYKTYDLNVEVFGADDTNTPLAAENYSLKVTDESGKDVSALTGLAAGHYNVVVTPTDAEKYIATTCSVDLPKVEGEANAAYYLPVLLNLKDAEKEYQILYAEVSVGGDYQLTSMQILKNDEIVATATSSATATSTKLFYLAVMDGSAYKLKVVYTDGEADFTREFNYGEGQTSFVLDLTSASTSVSVEDGQAPAVTASLGGDDFMTVQDGTIVTLNGANYNGIFDVVRLEAVEDVDVMRVFAGTPDGLKFSKALQISFPDSWGGELGELNLEYLTENGWAIDADGGSVEKAGDTYVMNVMHFSNFRAQLPTEFDDKDVISSENVNETVIDKKNDNDVSVEITYTYTRQEGMIVGDVESAVKAAGFTNTAAIAYVTNLVTEKLATAGYANVGLNSVPAEQTITVTPWTVLNKVIKTQVLEKINCVFKIAGKTVTVGVTKAGETTITPDMFVYGHGHGHAHGHGGDLNAGGGIIEGE